MPKLYCACNPLLGRLANSHGFARLCNAFAVSMHSPNYIVRSHPLARPPCDTSARLRACLVQRLRRYSMQTPIIIVHSSNTSARLRACLVQRLRRYCMHSQIKLCAQALAPPATRAHSATPSSLAKLRGGCARQSSACTPSSATKNPQPDPQPEYLCFHTQYFTEFLRMIHGLISLPHPRAAD